ncbi:hypothetical protein CHS0354_004139 [Potamilus streckersoni]|uniref:Transient receptor ion channel domain-containing protein n=1 Tax=Potamilus streckersoni TaxID=2493646 RepID=A0AAE0W5F9_9BIVA|nr:hypothetical protein CHS0354_004139 [Potamilus streckersoni]
MTHRNKRTTSRLTFPGENYGTHRNLSTVEEDFIFAAEFGDIPTVQRILQENPTLNVDFCDILGRTPLRLAVGNEHLEVVELLLDRSNLANIHEALLQAISAGREQIAESILKHPKYRGVKKENKRFGETDYFFNKASEDSPFSSDITPLILAAERNQFEIVQLLLLRGETITKPHHYYCNCQECSNKLEFDQLRLSKSRLNAYKGLSSGAYISLSSKDPILTAFELARELRGVAKVEKYYKNEYLSLADQLSDYVVKLLDKVRGHDELQVLIDKTGRDSHQETYERLARLKLAIQYNEMKFVAHPSCQQKLVSIWYSDLRTLERSNWFVRSLMVMIITFVYPLLAIVYWFAPTTRAGEFLRIPCIKFIGHTMSFVCFLVMILTSSITEHPSSEVTIAQVLNKSYTEYKISARAANLSMPDDFKLRTFEPQIINLMLTIWILGMLWQEIKQIYGEGLYNYFDALYNYLDFAVLTLYITSFTLRYVSAFKVKEAISYFESDANWELLNSSVPEAEEKFYWLIADRFYWESLDPHNVAEGLFALANIISFTRLSYVLPANELFGPLQISLARMLTDILKFAVIFMVVFVAFMVGLHNLYWYYPQQVRKDVEFLDNNITTKAESNFGIPVITFRTVFWSLFGRGDPNVVELDNFNHIFTETVGYWIFGAYNICTVIVLLNMLIAMMSRSFEIIQEESDTEWKFARSKLYMEYIKDDSTLPIPFNVIPTPKTVYYMFRSIYGHCKKHDPEIATHPGRRKDYEMYPATGQVTPSSPVSPQAQNSWDEGEKPTRGIKHFQEKLQTSNGFVRSDSDSNLYSEKPTYQRVMKRIIKRYIFDVQRENDANDDFDEIKQDISSFRFEMLNHVSVRQQEIEVVKAKLEKVTSKIDRLLSQMPQFMANNLSTDSAITVTSSGLVSEESFDSSGREGTEEAKKSTAPFTRQKKQFLQDIQEEERYISSNSTNGFATRDDIGPLLEQQETPDENVSFENGDIRHIYDVKVEVQIQPSVQGNDSDVHL